MEIKEKICIVFDIEVFKNILTVTTKNTENKLLNTFEISNRRNDINDLVNFFTRKDNVIFIGYNNIHYDNVIINYIIYLVKKYKKDFFLLSKNKNNLLESIFNLSKIIINEKNDFSKWKQFKYLNYFESVDLLTMLYSKALRVSLKEMQITMHYKNVQEYITDWNSDIKDEEIDKLILYNINDVESTEELLYRVQKLLLLRVEIEKEYNINCLSLDKVNLGMKILQEEYLQHTKINKYKLEKLRSPCDKIDLQNIIFPWIKFSSKELNNVLIDMKNQHDISPGRKGYINTFVFANMKITVGVGGIHGDCGPCIIKPNDDEIILEPDVASLYPSLIIEYKLIPPHLGKAFFDTYSRIKLERLEAKHNKNNVKSDTLKYALNGLSGNLQNENSWCYSPFTVMQIRINGQLLLLMLAEKLAEIGELKQINTDGIVILLKKNRIEDYKKICKEWSDKTNLVLETEEFSSLYQLAINDYFGVTPKYNITKNFKDDIKKKGFFLTEVELGKGLTPKIIPEAIINYFVNNIPIEETIKNCNDIRKFLQAEKTGKQWTVEYNDILQQRTNRFYVSNNGYYLWKYKIENGTKAYTNMLKGYGVNLFNKLYSDSDLNWLYASGKTFQDIYDVNYKYYIIQCKKIIEQLKPKQLSLF